MFYMKEKLDELDILRLALDRVFDLMYIEEDRKRRLNESGIETPIADERIEQLNKHYKELFNRIKELKGE